MTDHHAELESYNDAMRERQDAQHRLEIMDSAIRALAVEFIGAITGLRPPAEKEAIPSHMRGAFVTFSDGLRQLANEEAAALTYTILGRAEDLIADLSDDLRDEGCDYSPDGLDAMRRRVANSLPEHKCPDWLKKFRGR